MFYCGIVNAGLSVYHKLTYFGSINIAYFYNYPLETIDLWIFLMRLALCPNIHPNPGPTHSLEGFCLCNWNLNTLSKEDFIHITLLKAHMEHNYDNLPV